MHPSNAMLAACGLSLKLIPFASNCFIFLCVAHELLWSAGKLSVFSEMPLSVIIVGVGVSDFREMRELNGNADGVRRNTMFVELQDYQQDPSAIGQVALRDVQEQVVEYMTRNKMYPSGCG